MGNLWYLVLRVIQIAFSVLPTAMLYVSHQQTGFY